MLTLFSLREFLSAFIVLFAIIDIIGSVPIFINILDQGKTISAWRAAVMSLIIFVLFFYAGEMFLNLFHLDISSFAVAGAMIIFIIALEMILNIHIFHDSPALPNDATITPVVFPLLVGAGSLTTLLSIRSQFNDVNILLAILANVVLIYLIIRIAPRLENLLGPSVVYISQKIFGIILLAISVKLFITNLSILLKDLG